MLREMDDMSWTQALAYAVRENAKARETDDCRAGISAFLKKESPPWRSADPDKM
jgi:methylglutaconyl-CoA hydratase